MNAVPTPQGWYNSSCVSCVSVAYSQLTNTAGACVALVALSPTEIIVVPISLSHWRPLRLAPTGGLQSNASYCGGYAKMPEMTLTVLTKTLETAMNITITLASDGVQLSCTVGTKLGPLNDDSNSSEVIFDDPLGSSSCFPSTINSIGQTPWLKLRYFASIDAFWAAVSVGGFYLSRC